MTHPTWLPRESVFYVLGGANMLAGALLVCGAGFPLKDIRAALAQKLAGDESKVETDVQALRGVQTQLQGKGVILAGIGSLLLCAAASRDKKLLTMLAGIVAAGDLALIGLHFAAKAQDPEYPRLPTEKKAVPYVLGYAAVEAAALGSYLYSCTRH